jgi:hypothetical protein
MYIKKSILTLVALCATTLASAAEPVYREISAHLAGESSKVVMFEGEYDRKEIQFVVPSPERLAHVDLVLPVRTSIDVMGDISSLAFAVNGEELRSLSLDGFSEQRRVRLRLSPAAFHQGVNTLQITANHYHRLGCTANETYDLETELDLSEGAVVFALEEDSVLDQSAIETLLSVPSGTDSTTLLRPAKAPVPEFLTHASWIAQGLGLRMPSMTQGIDVAALGQMDEALVDPEHNTMTEGHRVLIGTRDQLKEHLPEAVAQEITGPFRRVWMDDESGSITLVVSGRTQDETRQAAIAFARASESISRIPRIVEAGEYRFDQIGHSMNEGYARRKETTLRFLLPAGFNGEGRRGAHPSLKLAYAVAPEVDSAIEVYVNGEWAARDRLMSPHGLVTDSREVRIPWQSLRPGLNVIRLEVILPEEAGISCPVRDPSELQTRFMLFGDSRISIPDFGSAVRYPDLASAMQLGYPAGIADRLDLVAVGGGNAQQAAALTLSARLARARGEAVESTGYTRLPGMPASAQLIVGAVDQISDGVLDSAPINAEVIRKAMKPVTQADARRDLHSFGIGAYLDREQPLTEEDRARTAHAAEREEWRKRLGVIEPVTSVSVSKQVASTASSKLQDVLDAPGFLRRGNAEFDEPQVAALFEAVTEGQVSGSRMVFTAPSAIDLRNQAHIIAALPAAEFGGGMILRGHSGAVKVIEPTDIKLHWGGSKVRTLMQSTAHWIERNLWLAAGIVIGCLVLLAALLAAVQRHGLRAEERRMAGGE